jgi:hypothetical protein
LRPAAISVLQVLFFFYQFSAAFGAARPLGEHTKRLVSHIPLIGSLNRLLGMLMGVIEGLVCFVCWRFC